MSKRNGHGAGTAATGPLIPERRVWVALDGDLKGMTFEMHARYPSSVGDQLRDGDIPEMRKALQYIVIRHNDWRDSDGLLPGPDTDEFWKRIPDDVLIAMVEGVITEVGKVISSRKERPSASASGGKPATATG